jgi:putative endonuclease
MGSFNRAIGNMGEDLAQDYLKNLGYEIIERNFKCNIGELDIIGLDGSHISFIEVKARYGNCYGSPCEAVTYSKQRKIYKAAQFYIMIKKLHKCNFRFDVVEVMLNKKDTTPSIRLIKNAFQI